MANWRKLTEYFLKIPAGVERVALSFTDVETIIESKLPASSSKRWFWANTHHRYYAKFWLYAGWFVETVDCRSGRIQFCRGGIQPDERLRSAKDEQDLKQPSDNGILIAEFILRFDEAYRTFYRPGMSFSSFWQGPCLYFHLKTIQRYRQHVNTSGFDYERLVWDDSFLEYLYATLTAWGMNTLRGGPKLVDFNQFQEVLRKPRLVAILNDIRGYDLMGLSEQPLTFVKGKLGMGFELLKEFPIMKTGKVLIGASKALHHLHPDLIPPVDGRYTLTLLSRLSDVRCRVHKSTDAFENLWKALLFFREISMNVGELQSYVNRGVMDTSVPKVIDNAVIGFLVMQQEQRSKLGST